MARDSEYGIDPSSAPRLQDTIRLSAEGLAKVLGDLEARVMTTVWELAAPSTARTIHALVIEKHPVALHTVITVLNRLVAKGLLRRSKLDEILHYEACLSLDEFLNRISRHIVEGVLSLAPEAVAASFIDVLADHDPGRLADLEKLIRRRIEEQEGD